MALPAQTGNRFQQFLKQAGLAVAVKFRFLYPDIVIP